MQYVVKHAFPGHAVGDRLNEGDAPASALRRFCVQVADKPAPAAPVKPAPAAAPAAPAAPAPEAK